MKATPPTPPRQPFTRRFYFGPSSPSPENGWFPPFPPSTGGLVHQDSPRTFKAIHPDNAVRGEDLLPVADLMLMLVTNHSTHPPNAAGAKEVAQKQLPKSF